MRLSAIHTFAARPVPRERDNKQALVSRDARAFPPTKFPMGDGNTLQGATADLSAALGHILGITRESCGDSMTGELVRNPD